MGGLPPAVEEAIRDVTSLILAYDNFADLPTTDDGLGSFSLFFG